MERFKSYEEYRLAKAHVRELAEAAGARPLSNDFLLPDAARTLIAEGRLSYEALAGNLYLLRDHGTFHTLAFDITDEASVGPVFVPRSTKVVWTSRVGASGADDTRAHDTRAHAAEVIGRLGFRRARTLGRMRRPAADPVPEDLAGAEGVRVEPARAGDLGAVEALLRGNFDAVLGELPDRGGLEAAIGSGHVLVARAGDAVAGVLHAGIEGRSAWIRQLAVTEAARGRHVGRALVIGQIERFAADVREFDLWVDVTNVPAVRLYGATGYRSAHQEADEYLPR